MCEALGRHETPITHAACEVRLLWTEQDAANGGVDAVRAHQHVSVNAGPVLELCFHPVTMVHKIREAMADMHAVRGQCSDKYSQNVGAVHLVVGRPECSLHGLRQRSAQQRTTVLPTALTPRERFDAHLG